MTQLSQSEYADLRRIYLEVTHLMGIDGVELLHNLKRVTGNQSGQELMRDFLYAIYRGSLRRLDNLGISLDGNQRRTLQLFSSMLQERMHHATSR